MADALNLFKVRGAAALSFLPTMKMPLVPTSSEYDRLLVEDNEEAGGGPMGDEHSIDEGGLKMDDDEVAGEGLVGLCVYKLNPVFTPPPPPPPPPPPSSSSGLKAPGFVQPLNLSSDDILVSKFACKWVNLYRATAWRRRSCRVCSPRAASPSPCYS
jgi:hypothetical protein